MQGAYKKWDSADLFLSCVDSMCERASMRVRSLSSSSSFISIHSGTGESLSLLLSKRKATWNPEFFVQVQRTEGKEGSDKATSEQRPANLASVSSAAHIQPVTSTVDKTVILKLLEQNFPECIDGDQFHSFHQCKESCKLKEPAFQSSLKGEG